MEQLGRYVEIILGGTPNTSKREYWDGDIPWASVTDFIHDKYLYKTEKTISKKGLDNSNTKLLNIGDIIISARGTVGKMVVCAIPTTFNQSCYGLRVKEKNELRQDYLFYLLQLKVLELKTVATGGVFDTIIKTTLERLTFNKPKPKTQQRIASILSAYDDLIEVNNQRIKLLEQTARELYKEWFVRMRFPGYKQAKFRKGVPEGWEMRKITDIAFINKKNLSSKDDVSQIIYIDISSVTDGRVESTTTYQKKEAPGRAKRIVRTGDTIFSTVRPENRAYSFIVNPSPNTIASTGFAVLSPQKIEYAEFIYFLIASDSFIDEMSIKAKGSAYPQIGFDDIGKHIFFFPQDGTNLLKRFHSITNPMFDQIETLQQQNIQLRQIRDRLLPRLVSGKIRLNYDLCD